MGRQGPAGRHLQYFLVHPIIAFSTVKPTILVLSDLSDTAEQTAQYAAALGAPLHAGLVLLYLYPDPVVDPELATMTLTQAIRDRAEITATLRKLAQRLPAPVEVEVASGTAFDSVEKAVHHYHPLLLAVGLNTEDTWLDRWLSNHLLPVLSATHRPLLLVPANAPTARVPRRVLVAVDADAFTLNAATRALAPLLGAWSAAYSVVHVTARDDYHGLQGQLALNHLRASGLVPATVSLELYAAPFPDPAIGVLETLDDTRADLLVLIARPRSFMGQLFHRSVTARILRRCRVPVLLLPAEAT